MVHYLEQFAFVKDSITLQLMVLLVVYGCIAVTVSFFLGKIVKRLAHFTSSDLDDKIIDCLLQPVTITIISLALIQSLNDLNIKDESVQFFTMAGLSFVLIRWIFDLRKVSHIVVDHYTVKSKGVGQDLLLLMHKLFIIVIVVLGIFLILEIWKINLTPLVASAGIAGIAIAMAAKDTLANFFGGISLFLDRTYKVGDYIIIDAKDRGEVVSLGIRSTRILTRGDVLVTVPNNILANSRIINETAPYPKYRIKIPVGVAYGSDLEQVENVLLSIAQESSSILKDPAPRVRVRALADSSVNFELLIWVSDPRERGLRTHEFLKAVYARFIQEGISIPFPQSDIHLHNVM